LFLSLLFFLLLLLLLLSLSSLFWPPPQNYATTWFPLDLVSGIPFGVLEMDNSNLSALKALKSGRMLKAMKLLRFLKLSRLIKGSRFLSGLDAEYVDRFEDFMADGSTKTLVRMIRIVCVMGIICHFMTVSFFLSRLPKQAQSCTHFFALIHSRPFIHHTNKN
jgi:hypothetical protein